MTDADSDTWISLSEPDYTAAEAAAAQAAIGRSELSGGLLTKAFEAAFAAYLGRRHAIAVNSGTIGVLMA
ncbi:MAG: DegT/DnrJ/EryC1/StrS family aminotransferase, partial [Methylophilaceae bacterium]